MTSVVVCAAIRFSIITLHKSRCIFHFASSWIRHSRPRNVNHNAQVSPPEQFYNAKCETILQLGNCCTYSLFSFLPSVAGACAWMNISFTQLRQHEWSLVLQHVFYVTITDDFIALKSEPNPLPPN